MAAGQRYKFAGSEIQVLTGFGTDSPGQAITAITRADPAVVTSATHGLADGNVINITGVVGMDEVNGVHIINVLSANTFELVGVDSSDYDAWVSGGDIDTGEFSNLCELTNYYRQGGTSPEIPATSLCSTEAEYEIGIPDRGTTQITFNFAPRTTIQTALEAFYRSGDIMAVRVVLPNSAGEMIQLGFVQQTSETVGVGGIWSGTATIRNTGARYDVAA